ncbi:Phosphatidylethanolamine N-methyltransferase [Cyphellophora attinorum]|uniref:Phosphatidylethanolamine N-methyltransferase n=1 Tax=Cyphellophora attinorum TaxID=1664694 RepID=A0A0N0NKI1_9EURO|nr:Phosphatidylethanolamine N-methyltransferase [Phialophora attinorum]KPI38161.1 Phosphatidylethanolamine N-methyltransferase [Phialophora attinorum]
MAEATDKEGLRQRNAPLQAKSTDEARQTVLELNALEDQKDVADEKDKKTFGRTPDGTVFTVPYTHDMVSQLLSPSEPKNISDIAVLFVLAVHIFTLWALPPGYRIPVFGCIYAFWRAGYNVGIGYLLHMQSHYQMLVRWARKSKIFVNPATGKNPRPGLYRFLKREFETKIPKDYDFAAAPIEYNTWLLFRRVVDLILMCDFVSYCLFAFACAHQPAGEGTLMTVGRWLTGTTLFAFNIWVKLDAHRVVKDFAWYWGDFFYLIDQELIFDGVFEMAPHPMYSIGYTGYYGMSLMAASWTVCFVSVAAHAAQFAFLVWVENPHIERTYSSPPPRRQVHTPPRTASGQRPPPSRTDTAETPVTHNLLGLQNIDFHRTTDSSIFIIQLLSLAVTLLTPTTPAIRALFVFFAGLCRIWYSVGIGFLLNRQSNKKRWTRHFLKYGESTWEAWRQWKGTYHLSMTMCYASFVAAAWKSYTFPEDWSSSLVLFKHVIGSGLIALQVWVAASIYGQLGEFGWFFGDFFFDQHPKLTYGGIYRFLNNPERVLGLAGLWGIALITSSKSIFGLALLSHTLSLAFIQFVERPHMQKLYGRNLRQDAGLVRSLRRSLPPPFRDWQENLDKVLSDSFDQVENLLDSARPKLLDGVNHMAHESREFFSKYPSLFQMNRFSSELVGIDTEEYSLEIMGGTEPSPDGKHLQIEYGSPIKVQWTAPLDHSRLDWVGLYKVSDNPSKDSTKVPSQGRWIATNKGEFDLLNSEDGILTSDARTKRTSPHTGQPEECVTGSMLFSGDKLFWTIGVYEFRYHHAGKHNVLALSPRFEIKIPHWKEEDLAVTMGPTMTAQTEAYVRQDIERLLLPVVQNCFDRDPDIAPSTSREVFGGLVERDGKFAKRVVYALQEMFGIEFAPEVVKADGKVENLAWRVWEAKKVLAPYSMTQSRGTATPVETSSPVVRIQ